MKFVDVKNHIGEQVYMNGRGDLAMTHKKYIYPAKQVFTIIKITKGGLIYLQTENGEFVTVGCRNIDLIEESVL